MKNLLTISLVLLSLVAMGQDCQLVSMSMTIPAGISKHHFPVQAMPNAAEKNYFTLLTRWSEGNIITRIRFSNDRQNWTAWKVLKCDYTQPEAQHSPLFLVQDQFAYFEWAVYNKGGSESALSLDFYYPSSEPIMAEVATAEQVAISFVGCPEPLASGTAATNTSLSTNGDNR